MAKKFAITLLELSKLTRTSELPIPKIGIRRILYSATDVQDDIFKDPRGYLLELSNDLGAIVAQLDDDGSNYRAILRSWAIRFIQGLIEYRKNESDIVRNDPKKYEKFFDRYCQVFTRAFVAEDVSATDNYENLEMIGDTIYRFALTSHIYREMGVQNKSIATELKHMFEKTKALANLAKIFHMGPLIRSGGSKHADGVSEDVFESVMGAMYNLEHHIVGNTTSEFSESVARSGFCHRLVRMVFDRTTIDRVMTVPPKTLVLTLANQFQIGAGDSKDRFMVKDNEGKDRLPIISLRASPNVVSHFCKIFGSNYVQLSKLLNATHCARHADVNVKYFSEKIFEKLCKDLESLGISQQAIQNHKNQKIVPSSLHARLAGLTDAAAAKGYWLGIDIPKNLKGRDQAVIRGMLYHSDYQRIIPKVEVGVKDTYMNLRAFSTLFDRLKELIERASTIGESLVAKKPMIDDRAAAEMRNIEIDVIDGRENEDSGASNATDTVRQDDRRIGTRIGRQKWTLGASNSMMFVGSRPINPVVGNAANSATAPGSSRLRPAMAVGSMMTGPPIRTSGPVTGSSSVPIDPTTFTNLEKTLMAIATATPNYRAERSGTMIKMLTESPAHAQEVVNALVGFMLTGKTFRAIGMGPSGCYMLQVRNFEIFGRGPVPPEILGFKNGDQRFKFASSDPKAVSLDTIVDLIRQMTIEVPPEKSSQFPAGMIEFMRQTRIIR